MTREMENERKEDRLLLVIRIAASLLPILCYIITKLWIHPGAEGFSVYPLTILLVVALGNFAALGREAFDHAADFSQKRVKLTYVVIVTLGYVFVMFEHMLPFYLWPYLLLAALLMYLAQDTAVYFALFSMLVLGQILNEAPAYQIVGLFVGLLFICIQLKDLKQNKKYIGGMVLSGVYWVIMNLCIMLIYHMITVKHVLFLAAGAIIQLILFILAAKGIENFCYAFRENQFQRLNDPEGKLLSELKRKHPKAFYQAVHTAYFCDKIAKKIDADVLLAKTGGYYLRIGLLEGKDNLENTMWIAQKYAFPKPLTDLLCEYKDKNQLLHSKEAAIVLMADSMVSCVSFLFEKDKEQTLDYAKIAEIVFQKQLDSNLLTESEISFQDLVVMKKIFAKETLYYDFLR